VFYSEAVAAAYVRGRRLRTVDIGRWLDAALPYLPGAEGRILDLGAGTGRFTGALADATAARVVACEPSSAMRAAYRAAVSDSGPDGVAVVGGAR
jgi:SAM-dependent methyltransferase